MATRTGRPAATGRRAEAPAGRPGAVQHPFEPRWPMRLALAAAIVLYPLLPDSVAVPGTGVVVPALESLLFASLWAIAPRRHHSALPHVRALSLVLVALVSLVNIATLVLLCRELIAGHGSGRELILAALDVWVTNVIAFGFWFWELDSGGPLARMGRRTARSPDLLFPQLATPEAAPPGWRPLFFDYLYVSFTNATAFSPTDTLPLTRTAKLLFMAQSAASLVTVALVAARAVNVLG